ncbi:YjbQ family protein [bacterium]|nr:YjbQ family protein [bacterium]
MIFQTKKYIDTKKGVDFVNIHHDVKFTIRDSKIKDGQANIFIVKGSAGVIVVEPLEEVFTALKSTFESWGAQSTGTGMDKWKKETSISPRIQSVINGRSLAVPIIASQLTVDAYDELFIVDFEEEARRLEYIIQIVGEGEAKQGGQGGGPQKRY